ncbi:hypothetical protein RHGRI_009739 [Rhododendron griersonianum]|uniref:GBF-interacting protein 1 N-terminal domain-containing protein n=1 Tax=Rhododendron griersonianum TaxID=479676 RepID=A0AAV6KGL5_9ERIC|nr:hypothetical protein RHGRI_009739 [Rhododendron griersonianum]
MSSGARVSIPNSVRKTIQNIKEITGNHSEEEIYAMLKECSMDPNETADKLLLQDPFHEVKRKRDRKKENLSNKESGESRWRPDAGGGRNFAPVRENGINQVSEKVGGLLSLPASQETKNKDITPAKSSPTILANGPAPGSPGCAGAVHASDLDAESLANKSEEVSAINIGKLGGPPALIHSIKTKENPSIGFGKEHSHEQLASSSSNSSIAGTQAASPGVYFSTSDPVLVPSHDSRLPGAVGAIKRQVGSQRTPVEQNSLVLSDGKSADASDAGSSSMQVNMPTKSMGVGKHQLLDSTQPVLSTHGGSSVIRSSSSHNSHSQQTIGSQKGPQSTHGSSVFTAVGLSKEWKPKPHSNLAQVSGTSGSSEVPTTLEANTQSCPVPSVLDSKEASIKLQRKLEELHMSDGQQVIIPNHLHVPEAEKFSFCFGSFDASYSGLENESNPTPVSETSESVEETAEQSSSEQNALATTDEGDYHDHPQSPIHRPENLSSGAGNVSSITVPEYDESKQEAALPPGSRQFPMIHTSPSYSFGFMPPIVGGPLAPLESTESQARDVPRLPSFVIPQLLDPASYYAQFYRSGTDSDGRISPFHATGVATKYNGNAAVLSPQTSQSTQEGGNSLVLPTAGPTSLVTQAAEGTQSSIPLTQQPLPVFRHPTGMPIPHYHPNYIPYGHYFSPFYVPPPSIHQFLSNGAFPQQPQAGSIYPAPPGATAKYSLPQYKAGNNTGNPAHVAMAGNYGYGSSPTGYNPSSTPTSGNSTANEDLATPQFKENNVYMTGQQSEGSAVWFAAPGRDISGLQPSSFYNIPPQGPVSFTPPQSHGTFTGIYHPAQTVSASSVHPLLQQSQTMASPADIPGPTAGAYQPQHAQFNWPNNY